MNIFNKIVPALLIVVALPQGLSAMEKDQDSSAKKGFSLKDTLFSRKGVAVLGGGAAAGLTWLTWSPTRTQQVQTIMSVAANNKGKIALGMGVGGVFCGLYKLFTRTPEGQPKVATAQWRDVREFASTTPTLPGLEAAPERTALAPVDGMVGALPEEEEPLVMDEAPAQKELPAWARMFISLCEDIFKDVEQSRQEEVATPILEMGAQDPFDLLSEPGFINLLQTNKQKAKFIFILGEYMHTDFVGRVASIFNQNQYDILATLPQDLSELLSNERYSNRFTPDQKQRFALLSQYMERSQAAHKASFERAAITMDEFEVEMAALSAEMNTLNAKQ